jgi:hypothetical protein
MALGSMKSYRRLKGVSVGGKIEQQGRSSLGGRSAASATAVGGQGRFRSPG